MNKVPEKALDSYAREINKAVDTKQAIIETVNFDEEYERAKEKEIQREEERTEEEAEEEELDDSNTSGQRWWL